VLTTCYVTPVTAEGTRLGGGGHGKMFASGSGRGGIGKEWINSNFTAGRVRRSAVARSRRSCWLIICSLWA
jgi:hypothetical protein